MPVHLPAHLPAIERLAAENISVASSAQPLATQAPALQVVVLNLMPFKAITETDIARILAPTPLTVDITLMCLHSHTPKHTPVEHLQMFYHDFYALRDRTFDGMIITGAPVEMLAYEDVTYWHELTEIFHWAATHVTSTIYLCWAAQAVLYLNYGIPKYILPMKRFGIFPQTPLAPAEPIFRGIGSTFMMPHSRHTELHDDDLRRQQALTPLAAGADTGISILMSDHGRAFYVMGHFEYPASTLDGEYRRDRGKRDDVGIPANYYEDDNPDKRYTDTWRTAGTRFYQNWLTYYVCPPATHE